jgi:C-terminal processing protease CtpA/Prc
MSLPGEVQSAISSVPGFDCDTSLSADLARQFFTQGYKFCFRYVARGQLTSQDLTAEEATNILNSNRLPSTPVFVLTSKRTFSGAEEFSYNLKALKRATIVGEVTGGGAHPTQGHRLDDHFQIDVPFARGVNPVTQTNWEGTGVEPDVKVDASQALEVAIKLATERIKENASKSQPVRLP